MTTNISQKPGGKSQFRPKYETQSKAHITDGYEMENVNNELFLYFSEGNFLKIKDFINNNHLVVNIKDDDDNNVLHKIILA